MIYFENVDGRVCIVFPYLGRVLLGSTDIRVDQPGDVRCEDEEVDYILKSLSYVFPGIAVRPRATSSIATAASGRCRAATRASPGASRATTSSAEIAGAPPTLCLVGGKWTTFRAFGEQAADRALAILGMPRRRRHRGPAHRRRRRLPDRRRRREARSSPRLAAEFGVSRGARGPRCRPLRDRCARRVLAFCRDHGDDSAARRHRVQRRPSSATSCGTSMPARSPTSLQRRTSLAITGALSSAAIAETAAILADELGWSPEQAAGGGARLPRAPRARPRPDRGDPRRTRPDHDTESRMRMSPKARMNRLFTERPLPRRRHRPRRLQRADLHGRARGHRRRRRPADRRRPRRDPDELRPGRPAAVATGEGQARAGHADRHGQPLQRPPPPRDVGRAAEPRRADHRRARDGRRLRGGEPLHAARRARPLPPVRRQHRRDPRRMLPATACR